MARSDEIIVCWLLCTYSAGTLLAGYVLVHTLIFIFFILILPDFGAEETAVAAYWVTDGIDRCRVAFLPRHLIRRAQFYDGKLVQVLVAMLTDSENPRQRQYSRHILGACKAVMIDTVVDDYVPANSLAWMLLLGLFCRTKKRRKTTRGAAHFCLLRRRKKERRKIEKAIVLCSDYYLVVVRLIHFQMLLARSLSHQCRSSRDHNGAHVAVQVEVQQLRQFLPHL